MQKNKVIMVLILLGLLFTGCGTQNPQKESGQEQGTETENQAGGQMTSKPAAQEESGELRMLCTEQWHCMSQGGYYYIEELSKELKKGFWGQHIMYMDFATKQEVYLCAEPGCKHIDEKCSAVLADDLGQESLIFAMNDKLYIVEKEFDNENSMEGQFIGEDGELAEEEKIPVTLYSMGLDGSDRKKEYTFDRDIMVEARVLGDGENIYFVTKKLVTSSKEMQKYTTATERSLVKFGVKDSSMETLCPLSSEEKIRWGILGVSGENIILEGTKYNGNLTLEEEMALENEKLWEYANDSKDIIMALNIKDGKTSEVYSVDNDPDSLHCTAMWEDSLYISWEKEKKVEKVDIKTGKVKKLADGISVYIGGTLPGILCCDSWSDSKDYTSYFVDMNSGEVHHSQLVNKCNGWEIEIIGEWEGKVLAIYDYDATEDEDGAWDIKRKQFGLIDKEDLLKGTDAFEKIEMKGTGM